MHRVAFTCVLVSPFCAHTKNESLVRNVTAGQPNAVFVLHLLRWSWEKRGSGCPGYEIL